MTSLVGILMSICALIAMIAGAAVIAAIGIKITLFLFDRLE